MACENPLLRGALGVLACALWLLLSPAAQGAVAPLSTRGNQVLIDGQPGSVSGSSFFWSNTGWGGERFYNAQAVAWLKKDWNAGIVRAAMGVDAPGGYQADASNRQRVVTVVDAAIANDMYVIIDWHSHHAERYRVQAIAFFQDMARRYGDRDNVIYEICNEPLDVSWRDTLKPYAQAVIAAIRAIDPDNLIVVGTPHWSQDVDVAAADPITGYPNIAYALHFYAGTHGQALRDKAQTALDNGVPLFVTEWGTVNADGNGAVAEEETRAWMAFLRANRISNVNWSITDKAEGAAALVPGTRSTGGWTQAQLTASGTRVRAIVRGWQEPDANGWPGHRVRMSSIAALGDARPDLRGPGGNAAMAPRPIGAPSP
ncbi:glycoside hydrolase family 5 protein [Rhodanobacter caeni]|uniref:Glycoside hydrolase family 5 domain-containing protein n=1 Tax=Rhodanobacter caeni TaxID=657654 RepID=A0ABP3EBU2_9GAMM